MLPCNSFLEMKALKKFLPHVALGLFLLQLLLMLVSWLLSAAFPMSGIRSLLSSEGLRWFMGQFTAILSTPLLVSIVLLSMAYGVAARCWLSGAVVSDYRQRSARIITLLLLAVLVAAVLLLAAAPHAVLLSVTGALWPSPFSRSLVPVVAFGITLLGGVYGVVAGRFNRLADLYEALVYGLRAGAPLLLFYVLLIQIYESLLFVLPENANY